MPFDLRQEPSAVIPRAGICAGGAGQPASLPQTVRHEGSSVHVSESLTRGGNRTPRKQSKRGNSDRVTGPAKPWITPTWGGQAKLRAVAVCESREGLERRVAGADPPVPWGRPRWPERSEADSDPTRRGMGNSTQRRLLDQRGRSAVGWGVATLEPAAGRQPRWKSERPMVPTKPVTTVEGRGLTSGRLGSGRGRGDCRESGNPGDDPEPADQALRKGEGGGVATRCPRGARAPSGGTGCSDHSASFPWARFVVAALP